MKRTSKALGLLWLIIVGAVAAAWVWALLHGGFNL
jgi:hypothetical protein